MILITIDQILKSNFYGMPLDNCLKIIEILKKNFL